ncbi:hypothetical protein LTR17_023034 [Elasticomyces elasticus]|nr:hypothetical protein LTR17_023034 [Elasticomyces elasticus]
MFNFVQRYKNGLLAVSRADIAYRLEHPEEEDEPQGDGYQNDEVEHGADLQAVDTGAALKTSLSSASHEDEDEMLLGKYEDVDHKVPKNNGILCDEDMAEDDEILLGYHAGAEEVLPASDVTLTATRFKEMNVDEATVRERTPLPVSEPMDMDSDSVSSVRTSIFSPQTDHSTEASVMDDEEEGKQPTRRSLWWPLDGSLSSEPKHIQGVMIAHSSCVLLVQHQAHRRCTL